MEGLDAAISRDRASGWVRLRSRAESAGVAWAAVVVLLGAAGGYLLHESRGTTFWFDEWNFVLGRRGHDIGTFLRPYNTHLSLIPIAIYRLLFATAGLRDYLPYRILVTAGHLVCGLLVFVYAKRRVGPLLALIAATLLLFLGPAWQNILWPFQIAWLISLSCGVGALLMLDRRDRLGDLATCGLLVVSLASSSIGVPMLVGAAVDVLWSRRRLRDAWIIGIPLGLYVVWSLGYQDAVITRTGLEATPGFAAEAFAGAMSSLLGLAGTAVAGPGTLLTWGTPLAVAAVGLVVWRLTRLGRVPVRAGALMVMTIFFWVLTGVGRAGFSISIGGHLIKSYGYESRYLYVSGLMILLVAVELARGVRLGWPVLSLLTVLTAGVVASNLVSFQAAGTYLRDGASQMTGDLAALDLVRSHVPPSYVLRSGGGLLALGVGQLFAAERALGDPAPAPAKLPNEPENVRQAADAELISALHIGLAAPPRQPATRPLSGGAGPPPVIEQAGSGSTAARGSCVAYSPGLGPNATADRIELAVPRGGVLLRARGAPAGVAARRFASVFAPVGSLPPGASATLRIPSDRVPTPWHLQIQTGGQLTICTLGPSASS